jgi:hypothetical protein
MNKLHTQLQRMFGRLAFTDPDPSDFDPFTPEELEEWEISFDKDLGDAQDG